MNDGLRARAHGRLGDPEVGHGRSHPALDLIPDRPYLRCGKAGGVVEIPVDVSHAREDGAGVAAAHRDDGVGGAHHGVGPRRREPIADVDAHLGHDLDRSRGSPRLRGSSRRRRPVRRPRRGDAASPRPSASGPRCARRGRRPWARVPDRGPRETTYAQDNDSPRSIGSDTAAVDEQRSHGMLAERPPSPRARASMMCKASTRATRKGVRWIERRVTRTSVGDTACERASPGPSRRRPGGTGVRGQRRPAELRRGAHRVRDRDDRARVRGRVPIRDVGADPAHPRTSLRDGRRSSPSGTSAASRRSFPGPWSTSGCSVHLEAGDGPMARPPGAVLGRGHRHADDVHAGMGMDPFEAAARPDYEMFVWGVKI